MAAGLRFFRLHTPRPLVWLCVIALALLSGCAGHSKKTELARTALDANQPEKARELLNKALDVKSAKELPTKEKKGSAVLVLDRSMVSAQLEDYELSSQDLQYADKAVEMLDLSRTKVDDIGRYLFSDDVGPYRGSPYEKVMINTMNMVNYLARHDLNGAKIEARRLSIMQKYLRDSKSPAEAANAVGAYLAGFTFERDGRADIALRYYDETLEYGEFQSLVEPIVRLSQKSPYRTERLRKFLEKHAVKTTSGEGAKPAPTSDEPAEAPAETPEAGGPLNLSPPDPNEPGDVLVIISYGRVPAKIPKRIPIGLALTYATLFMTGPNQATANRLAAQGLVTWINYPELDETRRRLLVPTLHVDGKAMQLDGLAALDLAARQAYDKERGAIVASAITRMITRVVAGETAGAAARGASNDNVIGALVSLGTQAALTAADTPDTRSWATLPARIVASRLRLPPGNHEIVVSAQGTQKDVKFNLPPGGYHTVVLTVLR